MSSVKDIWEISDDTEKSQVPLVFENQVNENAKKDDMLSMLCEIEGRVDNIRRRAFQIEEERDALFSALQLLENSGVMDDLKEIDRVDIKRNIGRIYSSCSTIEVCVKTVRDAFQEEALEKINGLIDNLIVEFKDDPTASKAKCLSFMNSCNTCIEDGTEDKVFMQAISCCTVDDRNRVKRRLQGLMSYIEEEPKEKM